MKGTEHDLANPDVIRRIIDSGRTIAIVGLSANPFQPLHRVTGLGACPSNPSLRGKGDAGRYEAGGSENRRRIRWNTFEVFWAENDAGVFKSFAAAEWHYSDRLLYVGKKC